MDRRAQGFCVAQNVLMPDVLIALLGGEGLARCEEGRIVVSEDAGGQGFGADHGGGGPT
jgi:hypothetical protein